ncbi:GNAT family N-acetyltransferase [Hamadaea tsunoensis]|uniref:GNAT family N-acetyltransferase n=1 Tax=Hamadaea tsunoensis TaxID=53368 RepID=UPI001FE0CBE5|nr:GNAT family protein [Hamadaea tsunoensis]
MIELRPVMDSDLLYLDTLHDDDEYAFFAVDHRPTEKQLQCQITESLLPTVDFRIVNDASTGEAVGWIRADLDLYNGLAQLGYGFARAYWGQGYATAAVRALVDALFGRNDIHKVWARVDPRNDRSMRVLHRAGFRLEGTQESHLLRRGERVSRALFGLTRARWSERT